MRFLFAIVFLCTPASAQLLPLSANLQQRPLPYGVSIPAVTSSSVSYPGCPGEVTTHAHTFYFADASHGGNTQTGGGLGTLAAPWDNPQAITGNNAGTPSSGYTQILLSSAPGGNGSSPIKPGDLVILNTGSYGAITWGGSTQIINSPALTIQAGVGQAPLLTTLAISEGVGWHVEGQPGTTNFKIQSVNPGTGVGLAVATDNNVALSTSDIIFENMDVSSAPVATADGWNVATWVANMRPGVVFQSLAGPAHASTMSCAALVNSHVYEVSLNGLFGAVEGQALSLLVQRNEIDHFYPVAVNFQASQIAIGHNYIHDFVQTGGGSQLYSIYAHMDSRLDPTLYQSDVYVYNNKQIESIDPSMTLGPAYASFFLNSTSDITNFVAWDNLMAGGGSCAICPGNAHNFIVANNSSMMAGGQDPMMNISQAHAGSGGFGTGPIGLVPTNGWVFNNIANQYTFSQGAGVHGYHNISAAHSVFASYVYRDGWGIQFASPTAGSVTTLPAAAGEQNLLDGGVGGAAPQAHVFTTVPALNSFPMSPQPDWTPINEAKTAGGVQLIPPITDYNGATFTSPYSIGALN